MTRYEKNGDADHRRFVTAFDEPAARDPSVTGGKGANLARLVHAGFDVPGGFCVTTTAYRALIDNPAVRNAIRALDAIDPTDAERIERLSADVRDAIRAHAIPEGVGNAVDEALADTDTDVFAVRSSATAEDLPTASFAGQHETYLGVPRIQVLDGVRDCMASLFTDRAVTYRLHNGVSSEGVALAVVVQTMADAEAAGVLFTADPITENRRVASVDANYGLGESIVAGEVSADNARVDRRSGEVLDYDLGEKAVRIRSGTAGGVDRVEVTADARGARVLSDDQLGHLVSLGERIEALFGRPQDIEWALVKEEFVLLQSRPITSLYPLPAPEPSDDLLHVYLSFGHQQAMPEALPPLVIDFWRAFLDGAAARFQESEEGSVSAEAGDRVYADLTPLVRVGPLRRRIPRGVSALSEPASEGLAALLDEREADVPLRGRLDSLLVVSRAARRASPLFRSALPLAVSRFVRALVVGPPPLDEMWTWSRSWGEDLAATVRAPETIRGRVRAAFESVDLVFLFAGALPRMVSLPAGLLAGRLLRRLFPNADAELDALGKGFEGEVVTRMNQKLGDLADITRDYPAVADALRAEASLAEIASLDGGDVFVEAYESFLDEFGHRATGEIDLSRPRWRENPAPLLRTVRSNVTGKERGAHREHLRGLQRRAAAAAADLEARAADGPFGPLRVLVVRRVIAIYRGGIPVREFPKQGLAHLFEAVHDVLVEAGNVLAADGRLEDPGDVWFLRREELLAALAGEPIDVDVESRRRAHERYAAMRAPPLLTSEGERPASARDTELPDGTLVGTPVSAGVVEGRARVVRDPASADLEPGEILVAPSTDPGWTPLFLNAAGLVMEVGGRMTHGALVAREYGIPAVASVEAATTRIETGARVRLDGRRGTIELLD